MRPRALLVVAPLFARALPQFDINSETCVDPSGFETCFSEARSLGEECHHDCTQGVVDAQEHYIVTCACKASTEGINCALSHCWNQVSSYILQVL